MTALLIENLPLLAGAPNGIKKLRELILELAIRGKLVPQDSNDEPASEQLKRIAEDKARLVAEGKIKKQKDLTDAPEPVITFPLPVGWAATSIGEATICRDGERVPISQAEREGRDKVFDYYGASGVIDKIDGYLFDKPLLLVGEDGANLINRSTPIAFMARGRYWVNNHAHVLDGISEELLLYIELYFNAIDLKPYVTGTAQPKMNQSKMNGIPVALPPVAEQHRIVAKVDELMDLCNRLEAQQADAESAHAQLVQALLDSLTQASDASDFAVAWQRLAEHFHTLLTTEPSIDALKQTLLQLAVMGKLVPQKSSDEPASELLKRIAKEKMRLIFEESLRTTAREDIPETEHYFTLHAGWSSCRLGNLARFIDYRGRTPTKTSSGVPLITAKNVRPGLISREPQEFITDTDYLSWMTRGFPRAGDILITTEAPMGNVAIIDIPERFALAQRVICFQLHELQTGPFLKLAMMSSGFQAELSDAATGMTATGIKSSRLKEIPIPIPPLTEQHRIVAKVDQLMALCDQLKTRLTDARQLNEQLASTLVEQALS
ncbi:restriction endonuclease subunit S [Pseudomonas mosselii]|uniref:restriction endonuclease subunit S n=1 Tax=unclassified Pseudomonas TaxID=196821 RepID=UPI0020C46977|nr:MULTISPECIES: restriction endonuclease subunit S [unclassified Pseudomonas]MCP8636623.1 restriction endonuclease subunit S [Pseudomonas sp. DVZ6]MDD7787360.1 restriction endonuclease subunit S [Pseudomonas sp. DVZ24]